MHGHGLGQAQTPPPPTPPGPDAAHSCAPVMSARCPDCLSSSLVPLSVSSAPPTTLPRSAHRSIVPTQDCTLWHCGCTAFEASLAHCPCPCHRACAALRVHPSIHHSAPCVALKVTAACTHACSHPIYTTQGPSTAIARGLPRPSPRWQCRPRPPVREYSCVCAHSLSAFCK